MTGQRIMFDLRMQVFSHLQRLDLRFYDRNPVGRLMTRVTTDVDVLNELFTSGVVSVFGDVFTLVGIMAVLVWMDWRLALVAFSVLPLIALITQWFRRNVRESYRTVRTLDRPHQRVPAGAHHRAWRPCSCSGARRATSPRSTRSTARTATPTSSRSSTTRVFYPAVELVSALAASLIIWVGGGCVMLEGRADARLARRLPPVLAALLPADQRPVGEVQRAAGRDGLVRAHLRAARYAGGDRQLQLQRPPRPRGPWTGATDQGPSPTDQGPRPGPGRPASSGSST